MSQAAFDRPASDLPVTERLRELHQRLRGLTDGQIADYIPALASADPASFGISLVTVGGHRYDAGDVTQPFTIQSVSKPFVYGMAIDDIGVEPTLARVGVEPSGDPFNSITLDNQTNRPFNPMVNAGAIVSTSLVRADGEGERFARVLAGLSAFAGRTLEVDEAVFASERLSGDRNRAIAYLMRNFGMLDGDVTHALDDYFRQCSVTVDCRDLAAMGASLATGGVHPITGERVLQERHVPNVLSIMSTCGLYDFAGEWLYRVGLPAKSGVSGAVVAVLPGQFGLAVYSPLLDGRGNSVRGIAVCEELSRQFGLHPYHSRSSVVSAVRRTYHGGEVASIRRRNPIQRALLHDAGAMIRILELQGDLYFGSGERIGRAIAAMAEADVIVVLDASRIRAADSGGIDLLDDSRRSAEKAGARLIITGGPASLHGLGKWFPSIDAALEWSEDELLARHGLLEDEARVRFEDLELLVGMAPEALDHLGRTAIRRRITCGEVILRAGEPCAGIHFLLRGAVSIELGNGVRVATLGAGAAFGEMAALDGGTHSTAVVADTDADCAMVPLAALDDLGVRWPDALTRLYANLARSLAGRLRLANESLRALHA